MRLSLGIGLLLLTIALAEAATLSGRATIVDADTIKLGDIPVRLFGIDAPELDQPCDRSGRSYGCGKEAVNALSSIIGRSTVQCTLMGKDEFGRYLGVCAVGEVEINATLVQQGWAVAFTKFSNRYVNDETKARKAAVGLWSGAFEKPWEWRLGKSRAVQTDQANGCIIKGNISRKGERIYHLPFQHFYGRTVIDEGAGERWFCSEAEALDAGWRRSLR